MPQEKKTREIKREHLEGIARRLETDVENLARDYQNIPDCDPLPFGTLYDAVKRVKNFKKANVAYETWNALMNTANRHHARVFNENIIFHHIWPEWFAKDDPDTARAHLPDYVLGRKIVKHLDQTENENLAGLYMVYRRDGGEAFQINSELLCITQPRGDHIRTYMLNADGAFLSTYAYKRRSLLYMTFYWDGGKFGLSVRNMILKVTETSTITETEGLISRVSSGERSPFASSIIVRKLCSHKSEEYNKALAEFYDALLHDRTTIDMEKWRTIKELQKWLPKEPEDLVKADLERHTDFLNDKIFRLDDKLD